jgi:hypothetical protein
MITHSAARRVFDFGQPYQAHRNRSVAWLLVIGCLAGTNSLCAAGDPLPDAATILDRYVEVTGGKAAYAKVENRVSRGHVVFVGMDIEDQMTLYLARPNKYYFVCDSDALGKIEYGSDGSTVWYLAANSGPIIEEGAAKAALLRTFAIDGPVEWRAAYKKAVCVGEEPVEGQACYKLTLTSNDDKTETRFYAKQSGLLVRLQMTRESSNMPPTPVEETFGDYKRVDGLLLPHQRKQLSKQCGTTREIQVVLDKIEHNVALPATRFDLPDDIKDALKKSPTGDGARPPSACGTPAALPDTPGGRCAAAFFETFNSGDDDHVRDFEKRYRAASALATRSIDDRIEQMHQIRTDLGRLTPLRVVSSDTTEISIVARASRTDEEFMVGFQLEDQAPHGLVTVSILASLPPNMDASSATPIDETLRKDTIKKIADALREGYVYPEVGERMAEVLAKYELEGRYNAVTDAADLAQRLTVDLFAVCKDRHFGIRPSGSSARRPMCAPAADPAADTGDKCGFSKVEVLPGNVGYVKFDMFQDSERARDVAAASLASVANCDALVFDLRDNIGGSPRMIQFISSYLFDKPTHLNSFYDRLSNKTAETWTLDTVPGKRFSNDLPVYVLTSSSTVSAAEEFTYNLKNLGRATIVGETTVGAAHLVTDRVINGRFAVRVPYARAYNPITKKNWEGVGVSPDIQVPASKALDAACKDAANKLSARRSQSVSE